MKYYKTEHYKSKDRIYNIYVYWYTTKSGFLKFHIEIYSEMFWNSSGFCMRIANYNTSEHQLLQYCKYSGLFELMED